MRRLLSPLLAAAWAASGLTGGPGLSTTVMPFILRGVRLIGVNSDNEPPLRAHLWQRMGSDLRPRHLARIAQVHAFDQLPALMQEVVGGRIKGRTVIAVDAPAQP